MKIAFIAPASYPVVYGGSEISVFYFARELASKGHEIYIITLDSSGTTIEEKIDNIRIKRYPLKRNFIKKINIFVDMNKYISRNKFDIIHFYGLGVLPLSYLIKILNRTKTIVTLNYYHNICHNQMVLNEGKVCTKCEFFELLNCSKSIYETINIKIYRRLSFMHNKYIVLSKKSIDVFKMLGFPENKMSVVPNIIVENPAIACKEKKNTNTILFTGRLNENKGVDILIMALSKIRREIKDIKCYIVGSGPELSNLKKMAHLMEVEDLIVFTGFVDHSKLESYYLQSDVFVFPVRWIEPFGRSLLEAMNYGLPSVVSDTVDPDFIGDAAMIFKNNDWNDLAEKIIPCLEKVYGSLFLMT